MVWNLKTVPNALKNLNSHAKASIEMTKNIFQNIFQNFLKILKQILLSISTTFQPEIEIFQNIRIYNKISISSSDENNFCSKL